MIIPLSVVEEKVFNLSLEILPRVIELAEGLSHIAIGIGAVMLLVVTMYYVVSMLDGGKFQMKMLMPLIMFFMVCNFSWIATPVLQFTTTMNEALTEKMLEARKNALGRHSTIHDTYVANNIDANDPTNIANPNNPLNPNNKSEDQPGNESETTLSMTNNKKFSEGLIDTAISKVGEKILDDFSTSDEDDVIKNKPVSRFSFAGLFCAFMNWLSVVFSVVLQLFGIMMTAIIVGFGPITFAFAIIPGRAGNVMNWFIRICQFALFAPICRFIDAFTANAYSVLENITETSWMLVCALTIINIVGLLSVPTIASMIIEGASGAVSLSQGLQTLGAGVMKTGGLMMGGAMAAAGKDNKLSNFVEGMKHKGLVGFGREVKANGGFNKEGFSKAFDNISAYGKGSIYEWNPQDTGGSDGSGGSTA